METPIANENRIDHQKSESVSNRPSAPPNQWLANSIATKYQAHDTANRTAMKRARGQHRKQAPSGFGATRIVPATSAS